MKKTSIEVPASAFYTFERAYKRREALRKGEILCKTRVERWQSRV